MVTTRGGVSIDAAMPMTKRGTAKAIAMNRFIGALQISKFAALRPCLRIPGATARRHRHQAGLSFRREIAGQDSRKAFLCRTEQVSCRRSWLGRETQRSSNARRNASRVRSRGRRDDGCGRRELSRYYKERGE